MPDTEALDSVRGRRQELVVALHRLERAIAAPASGRETAWLEGVRAGVSGTLDGWADHVDVTEGSGGLHERILRRAPRLTNLVVGLQAEHASLRQALEDTIAGLPGDDELTADELARIRHVALALLSRILQHQHRGADLIYEAYTVDIGSSE